MIGAVSRSRPGVACDDVPGCVVLDQGSRSLLARVSAAGTYSFVGDVIGDGIGRGESLEQDPDRASAFVLDAFVLRGLGHGTPR